MQQFSIYISLRYRFVNAKEHHQSEISYYENDEFLRSEFTEGSKGKYDISLKYWQLDLPLGIRKILPNRYFVEAGGLFSYILAADLKVDLISLDFKSYASGVELGLYASAGKLFILPSKQELELFCNFTLGMTPLLNDRVGKYLYESIYPREWLVQLGVTLWLF